jgi:tubulin polyglutamylase TTLL9
VQKYISDPLLIGGKKFDLRLYVLTTSYHPLTVYLYRSGFARFTHYRYDESKITNTEIHLTNVAIQKMTEEYNPELGGKWLVDKLRTYLLSKYPYFKADRYGAKPADECFYSIQTLIIKTLKSVQKLMPNDKHCF